MTFHNIAQQAFHLSNVVKFPRAGQVDIRTQPLPVAPGALSELTSTLSRLEAWRLCTKEDLRRAVLLLELMNHQGCLLISQLSESIARRELLAQYAVLAELVEDARNRISQI